MDVQEWLRFGQDMKWIGPTVCWVHDGPELTEEEQEIVDEDEGDLDGICVFIVRLLP